MAIENPPAIINFTARPDFRTQSDEEFNEQCQLWVDEQPPFGESVTAMGSWIKEAADYVDNAAAGADLSSQDAADFAAVASASASFKGRWPELTGSLAIPASVAHTVNDQDKLWMLLENVANVAAEQPGVSSKWLDLSAQGGLQLVSDPNDTRSGRAVNPTWNFFGAVYRAGATDSRAVPAVDLDAVPFGQKHLVSSTVNPGTYPVSGSWCTWVERISAGSGSYGIQYLYSLSGSTPVANRAYFRLLPFSVYGYDWVPFAGNGGGGGGGSSPDAPIKTQVQNFSADNQVSNNIAVSINCAEHTSFVINAQNAPFPNTSGAYNITISNLPEPSEGLFIGRIRARNLGRKAVNFILPAGITASWLTTPQFSTANTAGATTWDWIEFFRSPDQPGILYLDQVNGR